MGECCNIERVKKALKSLGEEQLQIILKEDKKVEATCPYCKKVYNINYKELEELINDK